jgi:hypothetical protein
MIYLVKKDGRVLVFYSQNEMNKAGFSKADKTVGDEEFASKGCYAFIEDGAIVVGKTSRQIEAGNLAAEKAELLAELAGKDYKVVKAAEAGIVLAQADPSLHCRREECRARINEIESRLAALA